MKSHWLRRNQSFGLVLPRSRLDLLLVDKLLFHTLYCPASSKLRNSGHREIPIGPSNLSSCVLHRVTLSHRHPYNFRKQFHSQHVAAISKSLRCCRVLIVHHCKHRNVLRHYLGFLRVISINRFSALARFSRQLIGAWFSAASGISITSPTEYRMSASMTFASQLIAILTRGRTSAGLTVELSSPHTRKVQRS